jgi:electron transport complex protein RnfC
MPVPDRVIIPLQDTPEDPYKVFVRVGDKVKTGQEIGTIGKGIGSLSVHATVSGEVITVGEMFHPLVQHVASVEIKSDGLDKSEVHQCFKGSRIIDFFDFLRKMGVPLGYRNIRGISTFIINTTEFEFCFNSRERIILEQDKKIAEGVRLLISAAGGKAVFLVEKRQKNIHKVLKNICAVITNTEIKLVSKPYPDTIHELLRQKTLIDEKTGKDKKSYNKTMFILPDVLVAIHDACYLGLPFINEFLSIVGSAVRTPQNVWVRMGTLLADVIKYAGGNIENTRRVTIGGALMGRPQFSLEVPVIRKTRGIYAAIALTFQEERKSRFYRRGPCVRCGKCVDVCPSSLVPNDIAVRVEHRRFEEAAELGLFSCLECGLCYYVCPSIIPLVELIKLGKLELKGRNSLLIFNSYKTHSY